MATTPIAERVVAVAHRILDTEGPDSLSVRRLATEADVAPMTIYNHFGSKDGVLDRLVRDGFEWLRDTTASAAPTGSPLDDIISALRGYRSVALARPNLYSVMFERAVPGFVPGEEARRIGFESFAVLVERVRAAQQAGLLVDADPVTLADELWATAHGLVTLEVRGFGFRGTAEERFERTLRRLLSGQLAADPRDAR